MLNLRKLLEGVREAKSLALAQEYFLKELAKAEITPRREMERTSFADWYVGGDGNMLAYEVRTKKPDAVIRECIKRLCKVSEEYARYDEFFPPSAADFRTLILASFTEYHRDMSPGGLHYEEWKEDEDEDGGLEHCSEQAAWAKSVIDRANIYEFPTLIYAQTLMLQGELGLSTEAAT